MTVADNQIPAQEQEQPKQRDNSLDTNIRNLARKLEETLKKNEMLESEISSIKQNLTAFQPRQQQEESYEPYVDHQRLDTRLEKFARDMEQTFDKKAEQKAAMMIEKERQQQFIKSNPDFSQVFNNEAILQKFVEKYPEIAEPILEMPDNFARKKLVYQNIKALRIDQPEQPQKSIQDKINENRRNPGYMPSGVSNSPYVSAGDFSETGMKAAYEKQQALLKNRRAF